VTYAKPPLVYATYPNNRWRKYMYYLWHDRNADHRDEFASYLCRRWNDGNTENPLEQFRIVYMLEMTNPDGTAQPVKPVQMLEHRCSH
jgi:hypothetical protein